MKKLTTILIIFLFFKTIPCHCQQDTSQIAIPRIDVQGHHQFSTKEILKTIPPGRYSTAQLKKAIDQLLQKYSQEGYYFTRINVSDTTDHLLLKINEGPQLHLKQIHIAVGDSLVKSQIESFLDIRQKASVVGTINFNVEQILQYLENNGHPFCKVFVDSLILIPWIDSTKIILDCHLTLNLGPEVTIDSIVVQGNNLTQRQVIVRETRIKIGELYNYNKVKRIRDRLMRTGLFNEVYEPEITLDAENCGYLIINVKEGNPNQLNAVVGYNPSTNTREKGYLTGLIDVAFGNLLGTGRVVEAYWTKKDRRSQELKFHYVEPWVGGYPIFLGGGFQQTIQDTSFIKRNLLLEINLPFSDLLTIHSNFGKEDVLPDSIGQILYQLPKSSSWISRIGFSYDTRNDILNPSQGILYQTQFEYAHKKIVSAPDSSQNLDQPGNFRRERWGMDLEVYLPTFRWQTIFLGLHGRQVRSNEKFVSVADLFRFGGIGSLRGYREEEFLGEKIAWLNLEYRYLLASRSRVFLFFDSGYFQYRDQKTQSVENYKYGYGFGLRLETRLGIIGIDYGIGEGRGLTSGLVHVRLTNRF